MTPTTIQLDKKTKEELFLLKNKIEKKLGNSISYNEVIIMLLENNRTTLLRQNLKDFRTFRGILSQDIIRIFQEERKIDEKEEKNE